MANNITLSSAVRQNLALLAGYRCPARDHAGTSRHRQEGQQRARQPDQFFHRSRPSTPAPATSAICSTASATACRFCKPPTPVSPSLQKLVDTAKSIANQSLQQPSGYSTKSSIPFTGTGTAAGATPAPGASAADLTTSKLNAGAFTFKNSVGNRYHGHHRYPARGFRSSGQDGNGPVTGPTQPGAGGFGSEPLSRDHRP